MSGSGRQRKANPGESSGPEGEPGVKDSSRNLYSLSRV